MTVVGVAAPGFQGTSPLSAIDIWIPGAAYAYTQHGDPLSDYYTAGTWFSTFVFRLAPGATFGQADAELDSLITGLAARYPDDADRLSRLGAEVLPSPGLSSDQRERYRQLVAVLLAIGVTILVLGCANLANLLIARGARLHQDRSIRLALGASRGRIVALSLTESVLLCLAGAAAGVWLAMWLKDAVGRTLIPVLAYRPDFHVPLDARVLAATLIAAAASGLATGVVPAITGARRRALHMHVQSGGGVTRTIRWLRSGLAATQLALSLALIVSALLLVTTLGNIASVELGIDPAGVSMHQLDASRHGLPPERRANYYDAVAERVASAAPVETALAEWPVGSRSRWNLLPPRDPGAKPLSVWGNAVTGSYFDVIGMRLVEGRVFTADESRPSSLVDVAVISDVLARHAFGDASAVGQTLTLPAFRTRPAETFTIVGVVEAPNWDMGLASAFNPTGGPRMEMYLPFHHPATDARSAVLLVKSPLGVRASTQLVERAAASVDPTLPVVATGLFSTEVERHLAERRTFAGVTGALGWLGFLLAAIGLYGLLAQSVTERTREFGIRIALGADARRLISLVARQSLGIAMVGAVAGIGLALAGTKLIEAELVGVSRSSPWVMATATALLVGVVALATLWPARAATRIEPVEALKME
jgi:predicted permease